MENQDATTKTVAQMLSKAILEIVDNNAHLITILDLQARVLARLEERDHDDVVAEINELLKERRRSALNEIDQWAGGSGDLFQDEE